MSINSDPAIKRKLILWLFSGCFLVFAMVVVGGITRLTGSGLSITEWKVVTGTIPPLNEAQWMSEFQKYQQIPQYKEMNSNFTLSDFKFIYFWEFIHRFIGRMIGFVFLIGLLYFWKKNAISKQLLYKLLFMFVLGGIQGFLGWYMVSSGLTENVRVSHIRLAIHLTFAFITFGYIFWIALTEIFPKKMSNVSGVTKYRKLAKSLLVLLTSQIIYGAFVAGTKAGWTYNTWPKMDSEWIPESISFAFHKDGWSSLVNNLATVQFIHRCLAYLLCIIILFLSWKTKRDEKLNPAQKQAASMLLTLVCVQVLLGIITLLSSVPIWMGVTHQAVAFFLFAAVIYFIHRLSYKELVTDESGKMKLILHSENILLWPPAPYILKKDISVNYNLKKLTDNELIASVIPSKFYYWRGVEEPAGLTIGSGENALYNHKFYGYYDNSKLRSEHYKPISYNDTIGKIFGVFTEEYYDRIHNFINENFNPDAQFYYLDLDQQKNKDLLTKFTTYTEFEGFICIDRKLQLLSIITIGDD